MKLSVKGQSLELDGGNVIAEGSVGFASFTLECDSSWDGWSRTVRFHHASQKDAYDVAGVVDGKSYYIPAEVLVRGSVFVSILGTRGTTQISTTELAGFFVEGSVDSGMTPTVTENAYAQYVSIVSEKAERMEWVAESVNKLCEQTADKAQEAETNAESCRKSAASCMEYAEKCQRVSAQTSGAEQSMNLALEGVRDSVERLLSREHSLSVSEAERHSAENKRNSDEQLRADAEKARVTAEQKRADAEAERISAERGRVAGEGEREARLASVEDGMKNLAEQMRLSAGAVVGKVNGEDILLVEDAKPEECISLELVSKDVQGAKPSRNMPVGFAGFGEEGSIALSHFGKNLIPYPYLFKNEVEVRGVRYRPCDDGGIYLSGATTDSKLTVELCTTEYQLPAGRYVVSGGTEKCGVYAYNSDKGEYIARSNGGDAEFTLEAVTKMKVRLYVFADVQIDETVYPMLRYFGADSDYEKWSEKNYIFDVSAPLYSLGSIKDRLVIESFGKSKCVERRFECVTLDGDEAVELVNSKDGFNLFSLTAGGCSKEKDECNGLCTHFPYGERDEECCWVDGYEIYIKLPSSEFPNPSDVSALLSKAYADGLPVKVLYELELPYTESVECITPILSNNINVFVCKGEMYVEYVRNMNTVFETIIDALISLDARISLLEV